MSKSAPAPTISASPPAVASHSLGAMLALGVEPEGVRACLLDNVGGRHRLVGWLGLQHDATLDVALQLSAASQRLGMRLGRQIWHTTKNGPVLESEDPTRLPPLAQVTLAIMPRPRIRAWLAGLSRAGSLSALRQALTSSPVQVVGSTLMSALVESSTLAAQLASAQPEVLIIAGGYDNLNARGQHPLLALCRVIGAAVGHLAPGQRPAIFYAGNREAAQAAVACFRWNDGPVQIEVLGNVQPAAYQVRGAELANALGYYYWRLSERLPGISKLSRWVTSPGQVSSATANFAQLTRIWMESQQLPELHSLYCTAEWWLDVWVRQEENGVRMCYREPGAREGVAAWPAVRLISGGWSRRVASLPALASPWWWDRLGLAPVIAAVGQVAPTAMFEALCDDILAPQEGSLQ
jgi:hypothetical protein